MQKLCQMDIITIILQKGNRLEAVKKVNQHLPSWRRWEWETSITVLSEFVQGLFWHLIVFISSNLTQWDMSHQEFILSNIRELHFSKWDVSWLKDCNLSIVVNTGNDWSFSGKNYSCIQPEHQRTERYVFDVTVLSSQRVDFPEVGCYVVSIAYKVISCIV